MLQKLIMVLIAVCFIPASAMATDIAGKTFSDEVTLEQDKLVLNGGGLRTKWFMKIYAGGLYLKAKAQDAKQIVDADEPMLIKIIVISGLMTNEKLVTALKDGYTNYTGGNLAPIQERMDQFFAAHTGEIKPDDVYEYFYVPGKGTSMAKNGKNHITIEGLDFKKATFAIWLGEIPAQASLKEEMLGKK